MKRFFKQSAEQDVPESKSEGAHLTANDTKSNQAISSAPPGPYISPKDEYKDGAGVSLENLQEPKKPNPAFDPLPVTHHITTPMSYHGQGPIPPSSRAAVTKQVKPVVYEGPQCLQPLAKRIPQFLWLSLGWTLLWFLVIFIGLCVNVCAHGEQKVAGGSDREITCKMDSVEVDDTDYTYIEFGDEYTYDAGKGFKWCSIVSILLLFGVWAWSLLIDLPKYPYYRPFRVLSLGTTASGLLFIIGSIIWLEMEQCTQNTSYTGDPDHDLSTGGSVVCVLLAGIMITLLGGLMLLQVYSFVEVTRFKAYFIPPQSPHVIQAVLQTQRPPRTPQPGQQPFHTQYAMNAINATNATPGAQGVASQVSQAPQGLQPLREEPRGLENGAVVSQQFVPAQQPQNGYNNYYNYNYVARPNVHQQWSLESSASGNGKGVEKYGMKPMQQGEKTAVENGAQQGAVGVGLNVPLPPPPPTMTGASNSIVDGVNGVDGVNVVVEHGSVAKQ